MNTTEGTPGDDRPVFQCVDCPHEFYAPQLVDGRCEGCRQHKAMAWLDVSEGAAELAEDLVRADLPGCADAVTAGMRAALPVILEAVAGANAFRGVFGRPSEVLVAQLRAWGEGRDETLVRSNKVLKRSQGCEECALTALRGIADCCSLCAIEARS